VSASFNESVLQPCPETPNCVSTLAEKSLASYIQPLVIQSNETNIKQALKKIIEQQPRWLLLEETEDYLHYQVTSWLFRFKDDVEFKIDANNKKINFRSASRLGTSDLGANRKRMEKIRQLWRQPL
jgi:uncharacterized protein (DUF1499 family)